MGTIKAGLQSNLLNDIMLVISLLQYVHSHLKLLRFMLFHVAKTPGERLKPVLPPKGL